jgi:hypothetical protein
MTIKFNSIKEILTKDQLKKILGGSGDNGSGVLCITCYTDSDCTFWNNKICRQSPSCSQPRVCARIIWA